MLSYISIGNYKASSGALYPAHELSYELAGQPLGSAPIVLVCHALTGNSHVAEQDGWWGSLIGQGQTINTDKYTILAFNIPGNGYDGRLDADHKALGVDDVARMFILGLRALGIDSLDTLIGASLGGGIAWQIAYLAPDLARQLVVVACDYKASDWLLAQTLVQERILEHSTNPIEDARIHAMLCYRSAESIDLRFGDRAEREPGKRDVIGWLEYHGDTLKRRFSLEAYKRMTYLTSNIQVCEQIEELKRISSTIRIVSIDSDQLFTHKRSLQLYEGLKAIGKETSLLTIHSVHGHDAFLMEYDQLCHLLSPYF